MIKTLINVKNNTQKQIDTGFLKVKDWIEINTFYLCKVVKEGNLYKAFDKFDNELIYIIK